MIDLPMPPAPAGSVQQQLTDQYTYLFQLSQQLSLALESLGRGTAVTAGPAAPDTALPAQAAAAAGPDGGEVSALRSLIVKTADTVERRMDALRTKLTGEYVAASDFGDYVARLSAELEARPDAVTQYYGFTSDLRAAIDAVSASFERYRTGTEGYIRTGIVDYDGTVPIYGVAVGQDLQTTVDSSGETVVEKKNFRAVYTASRLSFWQDGTEVAYVSNNQLYITHIAALGTLRVGEWTISGGDGLALRWTGG